MRAFSYIHADSLAAAVEALGKHGAEARILAGGQSLVAMMKMRIVSPGYLVGAAAIPELREIADDVHGWRLGSMLTYAEAMRRLPLERLPILKDALQVIADIHVRNFGTVGGACCQVDPHGDLIGVLACLGVSMEVLGREGLRVVEASNFFSGPLEPALREGEVLRSIMIPARQIVAGSAYEKFSLRHGDYAVAAVAAVCQLVKGTERCERCVVTVGATGPVPELSPVAAQLEGEVVTEDRIGEIASAVADAAGVEPDRVYGSVPYRRLLVRTLARRALTRAWHRARIADQNGGAHAH